MISPCQKRTFIKIFYRQGQTALICYSLLVCTSSIYFLLCFSKSYFPDENGLPHWKECSFTLVQAFTAIKGFSINRYWEMMFKSDLKEYFNLAKNTKVEVRRTSVERRKKYFKYFLILFEEIIIFRDVERLCTSCIKLMIIFYNTGQLTYYKPLP